MKETDLTKGKVIRVIASLALPIMGSSFLQFTYNLIDMIWVGRLGSDAVASIGSSSLFVNIGYAINALVVIGTGIKVSHAIGKRNNREVDEYINSGIIINTIIGAVFSLILILFGKALIGFLNLKSYQVEKDAYLYLAISAPILFFNFFNLLYTRILGSFGNNKLAFKINAIGVIVNIILDPIAIYILNLGVLGAALSTLFANILIFILLKIKSNGTLNYKRNVNIDKNKIIEIIKLGFPMAFQRVLFTIINILLAKIIAIFGANAIAAQKIGVQIESITYMIIGGFNGAVASFTGQNFGAKKYERIKEGYTSSLKIGIIYALFTAILFIFLNRPIIMLFIKEEETIHIASSYLKAVAFSEIFSAIEMISNGLFTGIGKPKIPAIISIVFTSLRIPLSLILIKPYGISGVWLSIAISSALKGIIAYLVYHIKLEKFISYNE